MAAKLIVTTTKGGSRITLVGTSGTELLTSKVFTEPRAKGATLRSLKGLLGDDVVVEDQTVVAARKPAETPAAGPKAVAAAPVRSTRRARTVISADAANGKVAADPDGKAPTPRRQAAASKAVAAKPGTAKRRSAKAAAASAPATKVSARKSAPAKRAVGKKAARATAVEQ